MREQVLVTVAVYLPRTGRSGQRRFRVRQARSVRLQLKETI